MIKHLEIIYLITAKEKETIDLHYAIFTDQPQSEMISITEFIKRIYFSNCLIYYFRFILRETIESLLKSLKINSTSSCNFG